MAIKAELLWAHVMPAHHVGTVGQTHGGGDHWLNATAVPRELIAPQETTTVSALILLYLTVLLYMHDFNRSSRSIRLKPGDKTICQKGDIWIFQRRADTDHLRIGFGMDKAWKTITGRTADAFAHEHGFSR